MKTNCNFYCIFVSSALTLTSIHYICTHGIGRNDWDKQKIISKSYRPTIDELKSQRKYQTTVKHNNTHIIVGHEYCDSYDKM